MAKYTREQRQRAVEVYVQYEGCAAERDEAFMDLVWHPGEAQADFGEVDVLLRGVVRRMHHFVLDFPYSNVGLVQLMPGENAECTCLALRNLFEWLGGVPERIVFDNAAGVGHKGYGEREPRLTHLFQAFQAHYGFDCSFCNPYCVLSSWSRPFRRFF